MTAGKFHLNPVTGVAGACRAAKGACPFGGEDAHFATADQAMANYETLMASMTIPEPTARQAVVEQAVASLEQDLITDMGTVVTLRDPEDHAALIEAPLNELGDRAVAGDYDGYYTDPRTDETRQARVTIDEQGRVLAVRVPDPALDAARTLDQASLLAAAEAAEDLNSSALRDGDELGRFDRELQRAEDEVSVAEEALIMVQETYEPTLTDRKGQAAFAAAETRLIAARAALEEVENAFHDRTVELRESIESLSSTVHELAEEAKRSGEDETAYFLSSYAGQLEDWSTAPFLSAEDTNSAVRRLQEMQQELEHLGHISTQAGEDSSLYDQAAGAFEPKLEGTADLVLDR